MAHGLGILCLWPRVCPFPKGSHHIWLILGPQHWHIDTCLLWQWGLWLPSGLHGSGNPINNLSNTVKLSAYESPLFFWPSTFSVESLSYSDSTTYPWGAWAQEAEMSVFWSLAGSITVSLTLFVSPHYNLLAHPFILLTNPLSLV